MADFVGTSGDDVQGGTSDADNFDFSQGGVDTLNGGGGNDVFTMGASLRASDQIDGGDGFDRLVLNGHAHISFSAATAINVERIEMASHHTYKLTTDDATVGAGHLLDVGCGGTLNFDGSAETDGYFFIHTNNRQPDSVRGGAGNDTINTDDGADLIYGGGGGDQLDSGDDSYVDTLYGGDGDDFIDFSDRDLIFGGDGNDSALYLGGTFDALDGGSGIDSLEIRSAFATNRVDFGAAAFSAAATGFEILDFSQYLHEVVEFVGSADANVIDLSGFTGPRGDEILKIYGKGGADTLAGNIERDVIRGGGRNDVLTGADGNDNLFGGSKNDVLTGGAGNDKLAGGTGLDLLVYGAASESTSTNYDAIAAFDFTQDKFDLPLAVTGVGTTIFDGALSKGSFDDNLAAAVDSAHLAAHYAVLFVPNAGTFAASPFLIVDQNGLAGYQPGSDLVMKLDGAKSLAALDTGDFV